MNSCDVLFNKFPRWVGPSQRIVKNHRELAQYIHATSGNDECFTSVYAFPFSRHSPLIDKLFLESDRKNSLKIGQTIFEWCTENHYPTISNWSGYRGPHVYPLCPNTYYKNPTEASELLRRFTYYILEETGMYKNENGFKIPYIDNTVTGDVRRLTRIPSTQRTSYAKIPLPTFCISLNPDTFLDLSMHDIHELERHPNPQPCDYSKLSPTKLFSECDLASVDLSEWGVTTTPQEYMNTLTQSDVVTPISHIVKKLLPRPCIHKYFVHPDCPTPIRYAGVAELVKKNLNPESIISIIKQIKWNNYDHSETKKQVYAIHKKKGNLDTTGKAKIQSMGFCNPEDTTICNKCR